MSDNNFSFIDKERLVKNIHKLKKNVYYQDIKNIILKHNPNIAITKNPTGQFLYFHDLKDETYHEINNYIIKCKKNKKSNSENSENNISSLNLDFTNKSDEDLDFMGSPYLKYSNKERNLIKKKIYNETIKKNKSTNVFIKKKNINKKKQNIKNN
jgi:hypothetical protein